MKDPSFSLSVRVLDWLKDNGRPQKDIAALLGVSDSFISRAARGERSLTLEHLTTLEQRLKLPLAVLLLESDLAGTQEPGKKALLSEALSLLRASFDLSAELSDLDEHEKHKNSCRQAG